LVLVCVSGCGCGRCAPVREGRVLDWCLRDQLLTQYLGTQALFGSRPGVGLSGGFVSVFVSGYFECSGVLCSTFWVFRNLGPAHSASAKLSSWSGRPWFAANNNADPKAGIVHKRLASPKRPCP
jgi:hypothetical protein